MSKTKVVQTKKTDVIILTGCGCGCNLGQFWNGQMWTDKYANAMHFTTHDDAVQEIAKIRTGDDFAQSVSFYVVSDYGTRSEHRERF